MSSVRVIARNVGVSVATVSRALNGKSNVNPDTRKRILAEAERVGYVLPRPRVVQRVIGLAYTWDPGRVDYGGFDSALMKGVLLGINEKRFDLNVINMDRDKRPGEGYAAFFQRKGIDGVILRTFEGSRHICLEIAEEDFPSIVISDRFDDPKVNYIGTESKSDSRRAVEHLFHLGHERVALGVHNVGDTDHQDRRRGFEEAYEAQGRRVDPTLVVDLVADIEGGAKAVDYLMSLPDPPTAIYFTDPLATLGALHRCSAVGLHVPGDLSIVGFDDSDVRYHAFPPFTAVCQDASLLGFEAARWLTRLVTGDERLGMRRLLPTTFEINRTTGPPAKAQRTVR